MAHRLRDAPISRVVSSPFLRAVETAAPIARLHRLYIGIEPGLSEWLNPTWFPRGTATEPIPSLGARFPVDEAYRPRGTAHLGESGLTALARSGAAARRILAELDGNPVLVGHGASILGAARALLGLDAASHRAVADRDEALLPPGLPRDIPHGCIIELALEHDGWRLVRLE